MKNLQFEEAVRKVVGSERLLKDEPLKRYTTWRVGGPADYLVETKSTSELIEVVSLSRKHELPMWVIGGGSNVLVGDKGVRGLVIRHMAKEYEIFGDLQGNEIQQEQYRVMVSRWQDHSAGVSRHKAVHYHLYDDRDANTNADSVFVRLASGCVMSVFIEEMFQQGITGLEKFARIPGTFGGWIYNNVHGHTLFIGEFTHSVQALNNHSIIEEYSWVDLDYAYNHSRFHASEEVIISGVLRLFRGDVDLARQIYKDALVNKLAKQPGNSVGCLFGNVTHEDVVRNSFESDSAGYIIDKILNWKGNKRVGGAWISDKNGNFIETDGNATAADIVALLDIIKDEFRLRFGIELREEFFRVGEF